MKQLTERMVLDDINRIGIFVYIPDLWCPQNNAILISLRDNNMIAPVTDTHVMNWAFSWKKYKGVENG